MEVPLLDKNKNDFVLSAVVRDNPDPAVAQFFGDRQPVNSA
jgi:hypothetical protein